jgi:hypothetical protein
MGFGVAAVSAPAVADANNGTIKVTNSSECVAPPNDPKLTSPFYVDGFGFNANEQYTLEFTTQPGDAVVLTASGTTEADGTFCNGPLELPDGQYKVTYTDPSGNKSKVFGIGLGATPPPTTAPPTTAPPTTAPPTTAPPTTAPPTTAPPTTAPPTTAPPTTAPPTTEPPTTTAGPTSTEGGGSGEGEGSGDGSATTSPTVAGVKLASTGSNALPLAVAALTLFIAGSVLIAAGGYRRPAQRH